MNLATRMTRLGTETAFEVLAKAKALEARGKEIIHLEIGEPDFDTPANIVEAGVQALQQGHTHYTPASGILPLREAIASEISLTRNISVHPDQVVVVPGGKPIMFFALLALCNAGDEVIYPNPGFPIYESMINFVGAKPVPLRLGMENEFSFDADELRSLVSDKTKLIILNSPANPTGGVISDEDLAQVADVALARSIPVLSDEIYSRMLYDGEFASITATPGMPEQTIILDGFSKTYAMTGWRLGYGIMPVDLAQQITKLMVNSNSCTAAFTQMAGVEAITGPQEAVIDMVQAFRRRRDLIVAGLNEIPGIKCLMPKGAFYVFPNIEGTGRSSQELADYLLQEAGIALLSGACFGEYGEGFLRLSYANSEENLLKALKLIKEALARL
ncbi:MAG: pyridoxal phosphate-dependent aminotransferase [Chloroflexi bacterium]|nr:pyridoxal phosphate-dependent aminotransferase [Chloroflexota bacterium]